MPSLQVETAPLNRLLLLYRECDNGDCHLVLRDDLLPPEVLEELRYVLAAITIADVSLWTVDGALRELFDSGSAA